MKKLYSLLILCCCALLGRAQITTTYTSGTTWTVPAGVTSVTFKVYGGAGGLGGQDCGAGCSNAAPGAVGYVLAVYTVSPGDVIGIYPGGKAGDGGNSVAGSGGGSGGSSSYNSNYNGGTGGNAGTSGTSGGGGGGGAASLVTINSTVKIVAGGGGGGGGMANSSGSGQPGNSSISANGTSTHGGNGTSTGSGSDGGGGGGGGGGQYGSVGGGIYGVGGETAGYGGYRGNNSVSGATTITTNSTASWTTIGRIDVTYTPVGGTASADQTICSGSQPADITLSGYAGTIQWQISTNNSTWSNISSATAATLTAAQMGTLTATRYYRAYVSGSVYSTTVTVNVVTTTAAAAPSGSGTDASPYLISNFANLRWISENSSSWDKVFTQTANIDAVSTSYPCYNSGAGWSPIGNSTTAFTGKYNGGNYTISNLYLKQDATSYLGLFGNSGGTISNLKLTGASITATNPPTFTYIGILAGYSYGDISGCTVAGSVSGGNHYNGGLAGQAAGTITNCSSSADVTGMNYSGGITGSLTGTASDVFSTGTITCSTIAGGIAGAVWYGALDNSYSLCTVAGMQRAGGAAGFLLSGNVTNVYAAGAVTGSSLSGGCIGDASGGTVTNCFWDNQTSGFTTSPGGGTGKTTAEMKTWNTFYAGTWDLQCEITNGSTNNWGLSSSVNGGYPFLSWQGYNTACPEWNGSSNTTFGVTTNWTNSFVPAQGMDIVISASAVNDLIVAQDWQSGNITFNNAGRKIKVGSYALTIGGTVTGANSTNYIQTNGTGSVKRSIGNTAAFTFPVGNSSYDPVTITNKTGAADEFSVRVLDEVYLNGVGGSLVAANRVKRTWNISKTNPNSGAGVDFTFNWNAGDVSSAIGTAGLFNHDGTNWHRQTGSTSFTSTSLTYTGYTGAFTSFAMVESSFTLPVTWTYFTAQKQQSKVLLTWGTASEVNAVAYEIQHSLDGANWTTIGTVAAAGNTQLAQQYSFGHASPATGLNFYRILQRDADGRYSYSRIVSVNFDAQKGQVSVYPNPVAGTTLQVIVPAAVVARVVNSAGATVLQQELTAGTNQLSIKPLAHGMYILVAGEDRVPFLVQ